MLDIVGSIVVHAVEVIASLDKRFFFGRELGKPVAELFAHGGRVVTEVDGVCEPGDGELDLSIACFDVFWIIGIPGICSIAYYRLDRPSQKEKDLPFRVIPISPPSFGLNCSRYTFTAEP